MAAEGNPTTNFTDPYGRPWRLDPDSKRWRVWDPVLRRWLVSDVPPPGYQATPVVEVADQPRRRTDPTELFLDPFGSRWRYDATREVWECWNPDGDIWVASSSPPPGLPDGLPRGQTAPRPTKPGTIIGLLALLAAVVGAVVLGIWAVHHFSAKSPSYDDGAAAAHTWAVANRSLLAGIHPPTFAEAHCTTLAGRQMPAHDDAAQWLEGCTDALRQAVAQGP